MLGLQIWISTVFRIARQFLTSLCDALRIVTFPHDKGRSNYFYPRKHKHVVNRILFDLKFWRRFVQDTPRTSFDYLLDRLPRNDSRMYSDASSLYGMGGVIIFGEPDKRMHGVEGVFWQLTWREWYAVTAMASFQPGNVKITLAEFLAALITCETCAEYCSGKLTTLALDNTGARAWFESARCPIYPLDRAAQGVGLLMLHREMKVTATLIASEENSIADICSRKTFFMKSKARTCMIAGARLKKVPPKWLNVTRFL